MSNFNSLELLSQAASLVQRSDEQRNGVSQGSSSNAKNSGTWLYILNKLIHFVNVFFEYVSVNTLHIGEVAQWLGHRIADRKVSSSSPALPTVLRVRDISNKT